MRHVVPARGVFSAGIALCGLLSVLVCIPAPVEARPAEEGAAPMDRSAFDRFMEYFLEGSARWRRDNPEWKEGAAVPVAWLRTHSWTAGHDVVSAPVQALYSDGRCEPEVHMIFRWVPSKDAIETMSLGRGGTVFKGLVELLPSGSYRVTGGGELPDGTAVKFRDTMDISDRLVSKSVAEHWAEGGWKPGGSVSWRRVDGPTPCR